MMKPFLYNRLQVKPWQIVEAFTALFQQVY